MTACMFEEEVWEENAKRFIQLSSLKVMAQFYVPFMFVMFKS